MLLTSLRSLVSGARSTAVIECRAFKRFLRGCALRSGQILNKSDLAKDVGISPSTSNQWLSALEAAGLVKLLEPWFTNQGKRMVKSPKINK